MHYKDFSVETLEILSKGFFNIEQRGKHLVIIDPTGAICGVANKEEKAKYIIRNLKHKFTKALERARV